MVVPQADLIVKNLAVPVLLGTSFMDKFVKGIFPAKRRIDTYNSQPVLILLVHKMSVDNQTISRAENVADSSVLAAETGEQEHVVRIARSTTVQLISETSSVVNVNVSKIVQLDLYTPF